jgi:hypothetical protein
MPAAPRPGQHRRLARPETWPIGRPAARAGTRAPAKRVSTRVATAQTAPKAASTVRSEPERRLAISARPAADRTAHVSRKTDQAVAFLGQFLT